MTRELTQETQREERLNEILLAYLEALEAGQKPDRRQLLAEHPDLREDLESFFRDRDEIDRLAAPLRASSSGSSVSGIASDLSKSKSQVRSGLAGGTAVTTGAEIGQIGDFRILREIGRGGMGVVYEAQQISLRRRVALKVLPFAAAIDPRQIQRFQNEALAAAHLQHPNIVPVHAVGCERGVHFYAMQFIEGQSLSELIADLRDAKSPARRQLMPTPPDHEPDTEVTDVPSRVSRVSLDDAGSQTASPLTRTLTVASRTYYDSVARLGRQAAQALEYAHLTGIVHRDIKPSNLLLDPHGQVWVTDFGLAQICGDVGLTATGEVLGTLRYSSPEQALARRGIVDHRSDIYSLGATLYELLTLRPVFEGRDRRELLRQIADDEPVALRSLDPSIPQDLETVILKALRKEPMERYATAEEMAEDLHRFLESRPIAARRPTFVERARKWGRRHPTALIAGVIILLITTVGSIATAALVRIEQSKTNQAQQAAHTAFERERSRAEEAESRFRFARRSVDELIRFSEDELAHRPGTEDLRKRLLMSALSYYQDLIVQGRNDPRAQAELLESQKRVEGILSDLSVLRSSRYLYLLAQPAVLDDLCSEEDNRLELEELGGRIGTRWLNSMKEMRRVSSVERNRENLQRAWANEAEVNAVLSRQQQQRLRQIALQLEGTLAFQDSDVIATLELARYQRERIREIIDKTNLDFFSNNTPPPQGNRFAPGTRRNRLTPATPLEQILEIFSPEQKQKWAELLGKPFTGKVAFFSPFNRGRPSE